MKRTIAAILTIALTVSVVTGCGRRTYYDAAKLPVTDFSEMTYTQIDIQAFSEKAEAIRTMINEDKPFDEVIAAIDALDEDADNARTAKSLSYIRSSIDASMENIAEYQKASDNISAISQLSNQLYSELFEKYGQTLVDYEAQKYGTTPEKIRQEYEDYTAPSDRACELRNNENELLAKYRLNDGQIVNSNDTTLVDLYRELVGIRNELALERGHKNYFDYMYPLKHDDYTSEEAQKLKELIKEIIVPLYKDMELESSMSVINEGYFTSDEAVTFLGECVEDINPELKEAYDCMIENHLYDIDMSEKKALISAYTSGIENYNSAFIFSNHASPRVLVHEFGHFNVMLRNKSGNADIDLSEIHSQGLEVLSTEYYEILYGERANAQRLYRIMNILYAVVSSCIYDEWERKVYQTPDITSEQINELFYETALEYGVDNLGGRDWIRMTHPFENPLYQIGYATSALAALEIWTESQSNRNRAIDKYMKITAIDLNTPFRDALKKCGLGDVFERKALERIDKAVRTEFLK